MNQERIEWIDSAWSSGWKDRRAALFETGICGATSIGFVFHEDDKQVTLCMSFDAQLDDAKKYDGFIAIPKVAIVSRTVLS